MDLDLARRSHVHSGRTIRGSLGGRREFLAKIQVHHMAIDADLVCDLHDFVDDLDVGRLQFRVFIDRRRTSGFDARAGHLGHSLLAIGPSGLGHGFHRGSAATGLAIGIFHDEAFVQMKVSP